VAFVCLYWRRLLIIVSTTRIYAFINCLSLLPDCNQRNVIVIRNNHRLLRSIRLIQNRKLNCIPHAIPRSLNDMCRIDSNGSKHIRHETCTAIYVNEKTSRRTIVPSSVLTLMCPRKEPSLQVTVFSPTSPASKSPVGGSKEKLCSVLLWLNSSRVTGRAGRSERQGLRGRGHRYAPKRMSSLLAQLLAPPPHRDPVLTIRFAPQLRSLSLATSTQACFPTAAPPHLPRRWRPAAGIRRRRRRRTR
jgi:hypothetical protein